MGTGQGCWPLLPAVLGVATVEVTGRGCGYHPRFLAVVIAVVVVVAGRCYRSTLLAMITDGSERGYRSWLLVAVTGRSQRGYRMWLRPWLSAVATGRN